MTSFWNYNCYSVYMSLVKDCMWYQRDCVKTTPWMEDACKRCWSVLVLSAQPLLLTLLWVTAPLMVGSLNFCRGRNEDSLAFIFISVLGAPGSSGTGPGRKGNNLCQVNVQLPLFSNLEQGKLKVYLVIPWIEVQLLVR